MSSADSNDHLGSSVQCGDHLSASTTRKGKIVGFGESHGRGRAASGDADDSGRVTVEVSGAPPRGEEGTLSACQRLIDQLNSKFLESWGSPSEVQGVQHIDAEALGVGPYLGRRLTIQVVRALTDPAFWQALGYHGHISLSLLLCEAADLLKTAIEFKTSKIPPAFRASLTLVLDATDVPGFSLDAVIDEFNVKHGSWVEAQGFEAVWVVGPWREMVSKLCRAKG